MRYRVSRRTFCATFAGLALSRAGATQARQSAPIVGILSTRSAQDSRPLIHAFRQGLDIELGGNDYTIEARWADGDYSRLPALAADLLRQRPDLLFTPGGEPSALAAKGATGTVPIVFIIGGDAVKLGLAQSYARPGGNATGFSILTSLMEAKRLEVLNDLLPNAKVFGVLINPKLVNVIQQSAELQNAAHKFGDRLQLMTVSTVGELDRLPKELAASQLDAPCWSQRSRFSIYGRRGSSL
jgi:putative tryptophan/tyrosine transport system substrate-binding protein